MELPTTLKTNRDLQDRWKAQIQLTCSIIDLVRAFTKSFAPVFEKLTEAMTEFVELTKPILSKITTLKLPTSYQHLVDNSSNKSVDN